MWVYADYLDVKRDFIPVFTEEEDRNHPTAWKSFIPHEGMRKILHDLIKALERGSPADRRPLWVHGSYGTGKTFAAFVVKHLLEDSLSDLEDYFRKHQSFSDLWHRLRALRERGAYLVVYRSSSSLVNSPLKLLVEVQQGIKKALEQKGYSAVAGKTIHERLLERLTDPESSFDWRKAFQKHRGTFIDFSSPEEVVQELQRGGLELTEKVARVLEHEGFLVIDDPSTVKAWLKEVIDRNSLQGIVFIWDEFTDFFAVNASTDTLQELAHATNEMPFYLLLVTHRSPDQFRNIDDATQRKLLDRFHNIHFEMKPVTAYQLMGNALEVKPQLRGVWETRRETLWGQVEALTVHLLAHEARKEDFKGLIPIHPVSAFLLSKIAREFTSSQRTLFRFLKEETGDELSFTTFLRNYPSENWLWFTADYLWDYFFRDDNPELTDRVRDMIAYYRSRIDKIDDPHQRRLFKAAMLLMALWRQIPGEELLRPTRSKLELAFGATPMGPEVRRVAASLCERGFLHALPVGSDEEYTIPLTSIDHTRLEAIRRHLLLSGLFERELEINGEIAKRLSDYFALPGVAARRQVLVIVSAKELRARREKVEPELEPYQVGVVLVACQDEDQVGQADTLAGQLRKPGSRVIYGVIQTPFGQRRMQEWVNYKAHLVYSTEVRDNENQRYYRQRADAVLDEWVETVRRGRLKLYYAGERSEAVDLRGYADCFQRVVDETYPYGPERVSRLSTLYDTRYGKVGAEIGLGVAANVQRPYRDLVEELERQSLWNDQEWFIHRSDHPLSRMKQEVNRLFGQNDSARLVEVWQVLTSPPYGLMPTAIGIALMGFLLRDYAHGYYWSDGINCFPLNHNKLAELIENVMKERRGCEEYVIRKMLPEAERFCEMVRDIFSLPAGKTAYPEEGAMREVK